MPLPCVPISICSDHHGMPCTCQKPVRNLSSGSMYTARLGAEAACECRVFRSPSLACACATALRSQSPAAAAADVEAADEGHAVDARDAVYMLNPSGDLLHTQDTFQDFFRQQAGWQVIRLSTVQARRCA